MAVSTVAAWQVQGWGFPEDKQERVFCSEYEFPSALEDLTAQATASIRFSVSVNPGAEGSERVLVFVDDWRSDADDA